VYIFKSIITGAQVKEFCAHGTKEECRRIWISESSKDRNGWTCSKLHFRKIIQQHTDESLGDCSFLNTCFHMESCKYVHYQVDHPNTRESPQLSSNSLPSNNSRRDETTVLYPAQWIQCDLRSLDMSILGI